MVVFYELTDAGGGRLANLLSRTKPRSLPPYTRCMAPTSSPADRAREWINTYTRDLSHEDLQRLFTDDTRDAYDFFARGLDDEALAGLPWWKRVAIRVPPGLHCLHAQAAAGPARRLLRRAHHRLLGVLNLYQGFAPVPVPVGTPFFQVVLLLPDVGERHVRARPEPGARQPARAARGRRAAVPQGRARGGARDSTGAAAARHAGGRRRLKSRATTKPANTVGGDFYDVLPQADGTIVLTLGDVSGKGSPAALLMALLLAVAADARRGTAGAVGAGRAAQRSDLPPQPGVALHHARLCRLRSANRAPALRERGPESSAHPPPRRPLRASRGHGHRARALRALGVLRSGDDARAGRPARLLQRRHHRGGEPRRPAARRRGAWLVFSNRTPRAPRRRSPRASSRPSTRTPSRSRFADDLTVLVVKRRAETVPYATSTAAVETAA